MDEQPRTTDDGLLGSGRVVSMLSAESPMAFRVDTAMAMVFVELLGRPCDVLLGFTSGAAVRFAEQLRIGFDTLCADRAADVAVRVAAETPDESTS